MRANPDNAPEKQAAYKAKLQAMTDAQLFKEAKDKIWFSAYASNNPRSCFHWQADATCDEAKRRGKARIYDDAYRTVLVETQGRDPHESRGPITDWEAADAAE